MTEEDQFLKHFILQDVSSVGIYLANIGQSAKFVDCTKNLQESHTM